jgi:hypothetical protein
MNRSLHSHRINTSTQTSAVLHTLLLLVALLSLCGNSSGLPLSVCLVGVSALRVVHAARPEADYRRSLNDDTTAGANPYPLSPHLNASPPSFMDLLAGRVRDMFQKHVDNSAAPSLLDGKSGRTRTDTVANNNKADTNKDADVSQIFSNLFSTAAPANGGDDISAAGVFDGHVIDMITKNMFGASKSDVVSSAQQQAERRRTNNGDVHESAAMSEPAGGGAQIDDVGDLEEVTHPKVD